MADLTKPKNCIQAWTNFRILYFY